MDENAVNANVEHDDYAQPELETPINIVSKYLTIFVSQIMCSEVVFLDVSYSYNFDAMVIMSTL